MKIVRLPFLEEKALPLECFDIIVNALKEENPAKTQCIFSSQLGKSRTTLGMAVCCIIKAVQMTGKLDKVRRLYTTYYFFINDSLIFAYMFPFE